MTACAITRMGSDTMPSAAPTGVTGVRERAARSEEPVGYRRDHGGGGLSPSHFSVLFNSSMRRLR